MAVSVSARCIVLVLVGAACGSGQSDTSSVESSSAIEPVAGIALSCEEIAASFVSKGSANPDLPDPEVSASCEDDTVIVTSNGIPDFTYVETSPGSPQALDLEYRLPANPTIADAAIAVPIVGSLGVAVNGIPIFAATEGQGGDVLSIDGALDACGGHNGPTGYHFQLFGTSETTDCVYSPDEVAGGPQLLGFALDGFPIYTGNGVHTSSWQLVDESLFAIDTFAAHTYVEGSGDLDQCNGMTDAGGNYAYYTTDTFPYTLACFSGVVDLDSAIVKGF